MTTDRNERQARKLLALGLDEFGHHTEAANVRAGIDLDDYRVDLWAIRAALDSQTAAAPGIDLTPLWRLSDEWLKALGVRGLGNEEKRLRWALAKELRDALSLIDASPKGATLNEQFGSAEGLDSPKGALNEQFGSAEGLSSPEGGSEADDAALLNWMDANGFTAYRSVDPIDGISGHCVVVHETMAPRRGNVHDTIRGAIRAAMKAQAGDAEVQP